jgi:hypothetical protein
MKEAIARVTGYSLRNANRNGVMRITGGIGIVSEFFLAFIELLIINISLRNVNAHNLIAVKLCLTTSFN